MSFAKKHMYKQGWVEGKGLGRFETGMKSAIKVKIKRDQAGVGHDMAEEFTFQWWDHVFNRAASKIKLKGEDDSEGSDSEDDAATSANASFDISNKKPTKKKYDPKQILYGRFVSGGLLVDENQARLKEMADVTILDGNGGVVLPASAPPMSDNDDSDSSDSDSSDSDDSEEEMKLYAAAGLSEEELLRRCGGRTAHKGARHGLKASAKLERIERQEGSAKASPALSPVPSPLTVHAASPTVDESTPVSTKKEKKKRKKRSAEAESASVPSEPVDDPPKKKKKKKNKQEKEVEIAAELLILAESMNTGNSSMETEIPKVKKRKKKKQHDTENEKLIENGACLVVIDPIPAVPNLDPSVADETLKKKKKKKKIPTEPPPAVEVTSEKFIQTSNDNAEEVVKKEKKMKKKKKKQLDGAV